MSDVVTVRKFSMSQVTIYHNPRCSKSRQALQILQDSDVEPKIVLYLETGFTAAKLKSLIKQLGISPRELLRKSEAAYKELNLKDSSISDADLIKAMVDHPKLVERPIVVCSDKAVVARPPELAKEVL